MMSDYSQKLAKHCENQIDTLVPLDDGPKLIMDPHQQEAIELAAISLATNEKAFSIIHSCGSGKTVIEGNLAIASQRAKEELGMQDTQDIILTTQRALLHTIYERLVDLGLDVGIWMSYKRQLDRPLVLASIQAIQNSIARGDLSKKLKVDKTPLLIGDEADLFLTQSRKKAISQFSNAIKIGLTATDIWPDGRDVEELWGKKIHEMRLKEGILNGVNVPPLYYLFEANLDDSKLQYLGGDYEQKSLQAALKEAEIQKAIPEVYEALIPKSRRKDFPTIVYVPSVNLVHATVQELMDRFSGEDLAIGSWTGESTTTGQIKKDMEAFNKGELDILVLCEMGARGVDLPRARFLIDGYPTLSSTKLEQRIGRVLRKIRENSQLYKEGFKKAFAMVAQIIPRSNKYRPILLPDILDCWEDFRQGRLLGIQNLNGEGNNVGKVGSPIQAEVNEIREHILKNKPRVYVRKIEEIDVLFQLAIRENLPEADEEGFFEIDGEKYGTVTSWFRELGIASGSIKKYLNDEEGITGKDVSGHIRKNAFYSESVVREKCKDLLQDFPKAEEYGFFELEGERYGTTPSWSKELDVSDKSIKRRLKFEEGITGKDYLGHIWENGYYSESIVRERCKDLLQEFPKADNDGVFEIDNEKYRTRKGWAKMLGIASGTIRKYLEGEVGITGKNNNGHVLENGYYGESIVREKCKDLLQEVPVANEDGFFEINDEKYCTVSVWSRVLDRSQRLIKRHLKGEKGITGKDCAGHIWKNGYYGESIVREKCKDLLQEVPVANEDGFFELEGERYGTATVWSKELDISYNAIKRRLKLEAGFTAKDCRGRVRKNGYYRESVVKERCKELLRIVPIADEYGFFEIDQIKYGTSTSWSREFGISSSTIKKYLEEETGIAGKDCRGYIWENGFYSELVVREKLSHLLVEVPIADENGFFELEGEKYGTVLSWNRELGIAGGSIKKYLDGEEGLTGKISSGHVLENAFYSESVVREKCKKLLKELPKADKDGFFEIDGEKYGTKESWSRKFSISTPALKKYLKGAIGTTGKDVSGHVRKNGFYSESVVREKCNYLLQEVPVANEDGFFEINGEKYGTKESWSRDLGISALSLKRYLEGEEGITGKDPSGHIRENGFYSESIVREKLAPYFAKK